MSEKNVEKEIEEINIRLKKIEQHIGLCKEHEETEGHGQEHESKQPEHGKKH
jgi:hypothetical protein